MSSTPLAPLDVEALLVALVLDPATYSRNRFFRLYTDAPARRARRRAALVRSIIRHLAAEDEARRGEIVEAVHTDDGWTQLTYTVPAVGLKRSTKLEPLELSLVRFALSRVGLLSGRPRPAPAGDDDEDRQRIESALRRLGHPFEATGPDAGTSA